jgi:hypothetical protein
MKQLFYILFAALLLQSCNSSEEETTDTPTNADTTAIVAPAVSEEALSLKGKMKDIGWIISSWEMHPPEGVLTETWKVGSDTELVGTSVLVSEKAALLFSEKLRIVLRDNELWYMATVSNQNDGKEIPFKFKSNTGGEWIFENTAHDYPQRIIYKLKAANQLHARIEGTKDGLMKQEEFDYYKIYN